LHEANKGVEQSSLEEMDKLWEEAKKNEFKEETAK
jgi:uncharacterized protein YabN with tetrapyrrole methylase and pyrophosphatase domain